MPGIDLIYLAEKQKNDKYHRSRAKRKSKKERNNFEVECHNHYYDNHNIACLFSLIFVEKHKNRKRKRQLTP
jgi:hypothetical protein